MCNADHVCVGIKVNKQAPILTRFASKQYIKIYQIHFSAMNAVVITFEAKKSVILISKSGWPNLNALKIRKQYSSITTIASWVYADVVLLYKLNSFSVLIFFDKIIWHYEK